MPLDVLFSDDVAVAARCIEAFAAVKRSVLGGGRGPGGAGGRGGPALGGPSS